MSNNSKKLVEMLATLSVEDKKVLLDMLSSDESINPNTLKNLFYEEHCKNNTRICPYCSSKMIVKYGKDRKGTQRFQCKKCKKTFIPSINSIFFNSHKDTEVWEKYIECLALGHSVVMTAEICNINPKTAFIWRHKILDALIEYSKSPKLKGNIQADTTFFRLSYKGSRNLPDDRKPKRRGTPVADWSDLVCVECAIDNKGNLLSKPIGFAAITTNALHNLFDGCIMRGSTLHTDGAPAYVGYAYDNYDYIDHKVSIASEKGYCADLNRINAYHSNLKSFMRIFKGVSTKYLNNYLAWFNVLYKKADSIKKRSKKIIMGVLKSGFTELFTSVQKRNPVPFMG